ncbi:hypothetical protein GCM10027346_10640 [Hymenobacter seoulensis]
MYLIAILAPLLLSTAAPKPATVTFTRITAATYAGARQKMRPVVPPVTFPVKSRNGQLIIPTTAGPQVFRDVIINEASLARGISEAESTIYTYRGYLTGFRRHVVEVGFYESSEWWLVSPEGRRLTLYGPPQYSPDQQCIAAVCPGIEYEGAQPNALQLFQLQDGVLRKVWEVQPEKWEPEELFWVSPQTLYLKRDETAGTDKRTLTYWKLTVAPTP